MIVTRRSRMVVGLSVGLAAVGLAAGIGLAAQDSTPEVRAGALRAGAEREPDVVRLPRVIVTPHRANVPDQAAQASERCTRLHC